MPPPRRTRPASSTARPSGRNSSWPTWPLGHGTADVARQLPADRWQVAVRVPGLAPFPAAELLTRRLVEVELHHCDLGAGYGPR